MNTEMHAAGVQEGIIAGRPTGFRRLTVALMATEHQAQDFCGFGDNGPRPVQILGAFKAAAPFLGYGARVVHAIDWLFRFTSAQDWREGARPIVWPSARMQQEELQLSPTRTKALNRYLMELGLIAAKDSPNGKRYGRRDKEGRIIEAYGFDLSPLAQRFEEFQRAAEEGRAIRARMGQLRRRATIACKAMAQLLDAAEAYGLIDAAWRSLGDEVRVLGAAARRVERLEEMEIGVAGLERRVVEAQKRLEMQLSEQQKDVYKNPKGSENGPHIYTYKPTLNLKDTVIAYEESSSAPGATTESPNKAPQLTEREEPEKVLRLYPDEVPIIAPRLRGYLQAGHPKWADIVDAADLLRRDLDISRPLWGEACQIMGREMAAIAVAIVSTKDPEHFTRTAGHYFHGMVMRAGKGELHLDRTVWGIRAGKREKTTEGRV
jgi:replication initiation protein RepC